MLSRLVKIYTPFICAFIAIIHGVLSLSGYDGILYGISADLTGHSVIVILYILSTSKKMCKWYRYTNYLLLSIHFFNIAYYFKLIDYNNLMYAAIVINISALISFLIYRVSAGITKILC